MNRILKLSVLTVVVLVIVGCKSMESKDLSSTRPDPGCTSDPGCSRIDQDVDARSELFPLTPLILRGDLIKIGAFGLWTTYYKGSGNMNPYVGPEGGPHKVVGNYVMNSENEGALIGKIGKNGEWFLIGGQKTFISESEGPFYVQMNDIIGSYADNYGSLHIILIRTRPSTSSQ